jgi:hypothetical protein
VRRPSFAGLRATLDSRQPAPFIVGVGRSGTTLLRLMLDAHPELAIPPETHFVPDVIGLCKAKAGPARIAAEIVASRHWGDLGLERAKLEERLGALGDAPGPEHVLRAFYALYAEKQHKPRWGDKTPAYLRRMSMISGALPEARFIHLIRDGRDVVLSRRRRGMGATLELERAAERWRDRVIAARRQGGHLGGRRYLELRYEDLVADPEHHLRTICGFIQLGFDPVMLDYHERSGERLEELNRDLPPAGEREARSAEERMGAHALAAGPPTAARTEAWREEMPAADVAAFEAVAGPLLRELGYPPG